MGHLVEYRIYFKDEKSYNTIAKYLNEKHEIKHNEWDKDTGLIEFEMHHSYRFKLAENFKENNLKAKCRIDIYYTERDPDEVQEYKH